MKYSLLFWSCVAFGGNDVVIPMNDQKRGRSESTTDQDVAERLADQWNVGREVVPTLAKELNTARFSNNRGAVDAMRHSIVTGSPLSPEQRLLVYDLLCKSLQESLTSNIERANHIQQESDKKWSKRKVTIVSGAATVLAAIIGASVTLAIHLTEC